MHLVAIAYTSSAVRRLGVEELDAILSEARDYNRRAKVTGALLHHQHSFFQYIEGPRKGVEDVYRRILASGEHADVVELMRSEIDTRQFSQWYMAFAEAPLTLMQRLASSQWEEILPSVKEKAATSPGLTLLLDFWSQAGSQLERSRP